MVTTKKAPGIKSNSFFKIIDNDALSRDEKKEAITQALTYDLTRTPKQQQAQQAEFAAFKTYFKTAGLTPVGGALSEAKGVFGDMGALLSKLKQNADATEDEQLAAASNAAHSFFTAAKAHVVKTKEGFETAEAQTLDSEKVKDILDIVAEAAADAAVRNQAIAKETVAAITKFNRDALKGLTPSVLDKVRKHIFEMTGEDGTAVDPLNVVKEDLAAAGKTVAKKVGTHAAKEASKKAGKTGAHVAAKMLVKSVLG